MFTLRGRWIRKITITQESILSGLKLSICGQTTVVWTNQRPVRNYWQLRAWFRCDDSVKQSELVSISFLFSEGQRMAMNAFLNEKDVLALLPTGFG